ncbi:MAG: hypothetical protein MSA32_10495 [Bacteroidales bacterium]|nr:hypothetical protein [Bacteroidales bacterium]
MALLVLSLIILACISALLGIVSKRDTTLPHPNGHSCSSCDGNSEKCEQVCMMEASLKDIVYFDDEELDKYQGRPSDSYDSHETEEFAEVLYSLRKDEVKDWGRSLVLRNINLPDGLKDDYIMLSEGM